MDKREYQEKLQEINRLIAAEDYESAARIADSIDWKRVRNVQTLVMVSEVYEVLERYEDSKALLLRAYRRSPVGRTVLYRLVECCIKLRQFDQAIEYYSEYVQAAPHDNNKYILKYKIYRGRGSSLDEQIDILKEYLDQEYNEKWAYELARLQIQAGNVQEGLATCDDLVLWFHSGKYVIRALELKKKYAPLTPKQQEIYDNRFEEEEEEPEYRPESYLSEATTLAKAERAAAAQEEIKTELAADISHTAKMEATKAELTRKAEEAQAEIDRKAAESRKAMVETAKEQEAPAPDDAAEDAAAEESAAAEDAAAQTQAAAQEEANVTEEPAIEEPAIEEPAAAQTLFGAVKEAAEQAGLTEEATEQAGLTEEAPEQAGQAAGEGTQAAEEPAEESVEEAVESHTLFGAVKEAAERAGLTEETAEQTAVNEEVPEQSGQAEEAAAQSGRAEETTERAGQAVLGGAAAAAAAVATAAILSEEPAEEVTSEQMQEDMVRSMREIVSGVGPREQIGEDEAALEEAINQSKEDQENAVAARGTDMTFRVPESEASQKRQAGRLTIDDILLSMGDKGDHVRKVTGGTVMSAEEEAQITAQQQAEAKAASYGGINPASEAGEDGDPEIPRFLREEVREARQTAEIPVEQIAEADDAAASVQSAGGEAAAPEPDAAAAAAAAAFISTPRVAYTKEIAEAKTRRLPVDEIRKLHEAYLAENPAAAEEAAKNASQAAELAAEKAEAEAAAAAQENMAVETQEEIREAQAPGSVPEEMAAGAETGPAPESEPMPESGPQQPQEDGAASAAAAAAMAAAAGSGAAAGANVQGQRIGEQVTREVPKSEPEPQIFTGRQQLKESQMDLFRGFTSIGSLSEQIAGAIWQAENRRDDRTSRTGNILILGAHGCGKTTIATGIAKAIAEDMGTHSVKMARIYAADLNRKDIAATIAKIAGGVLIVEEAGDLDDAIVDQLTTAMEFRTDGLIMILEDEQRYIHDLLMRHPRFTMKFTAQIYIPEYSDEELVNFGQIYANGKDYVFSEKAAEACRSRVSAARRNGEAVSVTNVIELTDRAIRNANTFFRRIGSAKKRYDSEDRIILREKDFR